MSKQVISRLSLIVFSCSMLLHSWFIFNDILNPYLSQFHGYLPFLYYFSIPILAIQASLLYFNKNLNNLFLLLFNMLFASYFSYIFSIKSQKFTLQVINDGNQAYLELYIQMKSERDTLIFLPPNRSFLYECNCRDVDLNEKVGISVVVNYKDHKHKISIYEPRTTISSDEVILLFNEEGEYKIIHLFHNQRTFVKSK